MCHLPQRKKQTTLNHDREDNRAKELDWYNPLHAGGTRPIVCNMAHHCNVLYSTSVWCATAYGTTLNMHLPPKMVVFAIVPYAITYVTIQHES